MAGLLNVPRFFQPYREELRKRFVKAETALFRVRYDIDDWKERELFLKSMKFDWSGVRRNLSPENEALTLCAQITHEEGIALKDQLNTLAGTSEENNDFSHFLKAYQFFDLPAPLTTDFRIPRSSGHAFLTWWKRERLS